MNTLRAGQQADDNEADRRQVVTEPAATADKTTPEHPSPAHPHESSRPWASRRADAPSWVDNVEPF